MDGQNPPSVRVDCPPVLVTQEGAVRTITLNRPDRLNAVNDAMVQHLTEALELSLDDGVRTVVLRGAGRAFCSGHDLKEPVADTSSDGARARLQRLQDLTRLVERTPAPVITVVHGWAVGAGAELALASDLVMATQSARFRFPEVSVGLAITNGASRILATAIGPQRAKRLTLLGETIDADSLYQMGLVSHLVADAALDAALSRLVAATSSLPPVAARLTKGLLNHGGDSDMEAALQAEVEASMLLHPDEYAGENGIASA